ncbi:hypothetical protein PR202_ga30041 [Eleusine coracana subsp. coracana]|uniref:Protein kinase domain-containing protein n=1 Tax=Eleusine coracana subsp. coracana TaxID=191504 RepID=A0AAV5DNL9_ELECO|nr:hypothetical protein PR202_ga30041 [Eleusine coracana subsp. coracana]
MATQNLCSSSHAHQLLILLQAIILILSLHATGATPLSFSYNAFDPHDFHPEADAKVIRGRIELLGDEFNARARGRAWHKQAVQLWDVSNGEAASFIASFNFSIQSVVNKSAAVTGHGMTFFLAPYVPDLPQESYDGGLGLTDGNQAATTNASGDARFVAVEFDIHKDVWDPSSDHIGIDVNNMDSHGEYTILPEGSNVDAGMMSAVVIYNNGTRRLDVSLIVRNVTYTLAATVDLRSLLPEQVAVGFSAATGDKYAGNHTVFSFSFNSTLPTKNSTALPASSTGKKTAIELTAGLVAGAVLVLSLVAAVAVLLVQRSRRQQQDEEKLTTDGDESLDAVDDKDFESGTGPRPIPYAQLTAATRDFAEDGKLGQGGSGSVYRGYLKEHDRDVAIKVFARGASMEGRKEYRSEVTVISRLRHRNLVQLIGWCHGRRRLLLVYELVSNGSLDRHLYDMEATLTWPIRYECT